jgi:hypothetical protein
MLATGPTLAHAIVGARWGRRAFLSACLHPGWWAALCWLTHKALTAPVLAAAMANPAGHSAEVACTGEGIAFRQCAPVASGGDAVLPAIPVNANGVAGVLRTITFTAELFRFAGIALIAVAIVAGVFSLLTTPTHMVGRDRQLRAVGRGASRPTLANRAANRGAYTRIRAGHAGMVADWRASKRDAANLDKRLARVGAWRLKRWHRRQAHERAQGVSDSGLTQPRFYDRWLIRRVEPPKTKLGRKAAERRAEKRTARKAGPAPYPDDTLPPPPPKRTSKETPERPRPGHDPDAPPPAPDHEPAGARS